MAEPGGKAAQAVERGKSYLKEGTGVILSLAIAALTFYVFLDIYWIAKAPMADEAGQVIQPRVDAYNRQKDMFAFLVAIFGTVTGWYFGRVPAEKQADIAMQAADSAKKSEETTREMVKTDLNELRGQMIGMRSDMAPDINLRIDHILAKVDRA